MPAQLKETTMDPGQAPPCCVVGAFWPTTARAPADSVERLMGSKAEARLWPSFSDKAEFASEDLLDV